ncbi:hypothetical protein HanIR_Chr10g0460551 [Helianthus annuus]|nr:hypothetical protein HanIR_Chr10g0460551 [Helianthus annuus]
MDSVYKPASMAAIAAVLRRRRSFMWLRRLQMLSESDGHVCWLLMPEKVKLSSDQQMLSRRNAAEARRFPVCKRAIASSINPRWQHA